MEAEWGDMEYFERGEVCQCCKKKLPRHKFRMTYYTESGEARYKAMKICNDCRETVPKGKGAVKWGSRGQKADDISRPSIIDLMESYRDGH